MLDGGQDLGEDNLAVDVRELPLGADLGVELSPASILHHQVQARQGLHHLVKSYDVGVVQALHAGDFS